MYSVSTVTSANVTLLDASWDELGEPGEKEDGQLIGLANFRRRDAWVFACLLLLLIWLLALLGNLLVMLVIQRSRRVQSTTNFFVVSLAAGDLALLLLVAPLVAARVLSTRGHWQAGDTLCRLVRFVQFTCMSSTSLVLVDMCADRFYTILYPLSFKITRGTAKRLILCAWAVAVIVSAPSIFFFHLERVYAMTEGHTEASYRPVSVCPAFIPATYTAGLIYAFLCLVTHCVCPLVLLAIGYFRIFRHIYIVHRHARRCTGAQTCHTFSNNRNRYLASPATIDNISSTCNNNNMNINNNNNNNTSSFRRNITSISGARTVTFATALNPNPQHSSACLANRQHNPVPRAKVKMVRMLAWLTSATLALQLPYIISHLTYTASSQRLLPADAYLVSFWLLVASAALKPIIYACGNGNFWRGCKEMLCMSAMRCYRLNNYTITRASAVSRRNYVGVLDTIKQQDIHARVVPPDMAFDRDKVKDKTAWPINGSALPSSWL